MKKQNLLKEHPISTGKKYIFWDVSLLTKWRIAAKILYTVWISSGLKPITFMASATTLNSAASLIED
jgi:hypothetical protein